VRGLISFHPVDVELFAELFEPLVAGDKVNPERFLARAFRNRKAAWQCAGYKLALRGLLETSEPPPPEAGSVWDRVRSRLKRLDHRPDPLAALLEEKLDVDLHLEGRPYLVTESSPEQVARLVAEYAAPESDIDALIREQLVRIDPKLAGRVEPPTDQAMPADVRQRADLLDELKQLFDLGNAARRNENWNSGGGARRPARQLLGESLAYRAVQLHGRAVPFWSARDVDGIEVICEASGLTPPAFLTTARGLFPRAALEFDTLDDGFHTHPRSGQSVGGYVPPQHVGDLVTFLTDHGARIIQAATRHGEGAAANLLLRKIRECATFAGKQRMGYLEAAGIAGPGPTAGD